MKNPGLCAAAQHRAGPLELRPSAARLGQRHWDHEWPQAIGTAANACRIWPVSPWKSRNKRFKLTTAPTQ